MRQQPLTHPVLALSKKGKTLTTRSLFGRMAAVIGAVALLMMALVAPAHAAPGPIDTQNNPLSLTVHKHAQQSGDVTDGDPSGTPPDPKSDGLNDVPFLLMKIGVENVDNGKDFDPRSDLTLSNAIEANTYSLDKTTFAYADNNATSDTVPATITFTTTVDQNEVTRTFALTAIGDPKVTATAEDGTKGVAKWDQDLEQGWYVVVEGEAEDNTNNIVQKADPFLVALPTLKTDNSGWVYDVHVFPKNSVSTPTKEITNGADGSAKDIEYTITVPVPGLAEGKSFTTFKVSDALDEKLTFLTTNTYNDDGVTVAENGTKNLVVTVGKGTEDSPYAVVDASNYTVQTPTDAGGTVLVTFNEQGMSFLEQHKGENVRVQFKASATATGQIKNTADVYINDPNKFVTTDETDVPDEPGGNGGNTAYLGQLLIFKHDEAGTALPGAEFELYVATLKDNGDPNTAADYEQGPKVTGLEAADNFDGTVVDGSKLVTNDEGQVKVKVLKTGHYFLKEIKAPAGYVLPENPLKLINVSAKDSTAPQDPTQDDEDNNYWQVVNTQQTGPALPLTGAAGQKLLLMGGTAVLLMAGGSAMLARRRKARQY